MPTALRTVPPATFETRLLERVLARSPAQTLFRMRAASRLAVLAYHGIRDATRFKAHLDELRRTAVPVSLDDVLSALCHGVTLPRRAVLVTFDDGDRTVLDIAAPELYSRGIPAVAFVVPGLLDGDTPYWWMEAEELARFGGRTAVAPAQGLVTALKSVPDVDRMRALDELRSTASRGANRHRQLLTKELPLLEAAGVAVGNHTLTHPCLDRCESAVITWEVTEAHRRLTDALGHEPRAFAYPNGNWDERVRAAVAAHGYRVAFLFDHALSAMPAVDPLRISRVRIDADASVDRLRILLSGLQPALLRASSRI
jgi:peptidoglycan/xylan/chitin deacetylase (PgdA/CDA1 family)